MLSILKKYPILMQILIGVCSTLGMGLWFISIITIQSYPTVGGYWTTDFNTYGVGKDLVISPFNGTQFGIDLEFDSLYCGVDEVSPTIYDDKVIYENWDCNDVGYFKVKVLSSGEHTLRFDFGRDTEFAYNFATYESNRQHYTGHYRILSQTESELDYDVKIIYINQNSSKICLERKAKNENPNSISFYKTSELIKQDNIKVKMDKGKDSFCYTTNTKEDTYLKFGDNSLIIIQITSAEHLNENQIFISDIFNETIERDNIWSEPIYHNEYVRIIFEQNLTNGNDIKVYVRNNQSFNTTIEVYLTDGTYLMTYPIITDTDYYRMYLTNMIGTNDTFDLKIVNLDNNSNSYLEFDHIIDPPAAPAWTSNLADTPDTVTSGQAITYTATANDNGGGANDPYWLVVCSYNLIDANKPKAGGTCDSPGELMCQDTSTLFDSEATCDYTTDDGDIGDLVAYGFLCGADGRCSASTSETTTVEAEQLAPTFSNMKINETNVFEGMAINHSGTISETPDGYIFSWNGSSGCTAGWTNSSWLDVSGDSYVAWNVSEIESGCAGKTIGWKLWANNSAGWGVSDEQMYDVYKYGVLEVSISTPDDNSNWYEGDINRTIEAIVTCTGGAGAKCGTVSALARYNVSLETPNTAINMTDGANPFYVNINDDIKTYYFDASDGAIINDNTAWAIPNNIFDGNISTSSITIASGDEDTNYVRSEGTNSEIFGRTINNVTGRFYGGDGPTVSTVNTQIYTDNLDELLGTLQLIGVDSGWSNDVILNIPTGGWTWQKINDLESNSFMVGTMGILSSIYIDINSSGELNPQSATLNNGESFYPNWTLNVTSSSTESFEIDVFFNSSLNGVTDNHTEDRTVNLNPSGEVGDTSFNITLFDSSVTQSSESEILTNNIEFNITTGNSQKEIVPCVIASTCQDDTHMITFTNNGDTTENWQIKLNQTISCFVVYGSLSSDMSSEFAFTTNYQSINSSVEVGEEDKLWIKGNATGCSVNDEISIQLIHTAT